MKKLIALLLCCVLPVCLLAACGTDGAETPETEANPSVATPADIATEASASERVSEASEEHDHEHINYKGLDAASYTLEDVVAAEGREPDFSFDVGETTYYAYNDVSLDELTFTQVQFSFSETGNRVSCTVSGDGGTDAALETIRAAMTAKFGEPSASENTYSWYDGHTANYAMLTVLNETTVQLAFYIREGAEG